MLYIHCDRIVAVVVVTAILFNSPTGASAGISNTFVDTVKFNFLTFLNFGLESYLKCTVKPSVGILEKERAN